MESQPQNPEFRSNPESFHPRIIGERQLNQTWHINSRPSKQYQHRSNSGTVN